MSDTQSTSFVEKYAKKSERIRFDEKALLKEFGARIDAAFPDVASRSKEVQKDLSQALLVQYLKSSLGEAGVHPELKVYYDHEHYEKLAREMLSDVHLWVPEDELKSSVHALLQDVGTLAQSVVEHNHAVATQKSSWIQSA